MRTIKAISDKLKTELPRLQSTYKVESLGIFGSYVRGKQDGESDIDILVTFSEPPSLFEFIRLKNHLSDLLNAEVDLVMRKALKPHIGKQVLSEVVTIP
ncbi:MAG TPA: nucleotidyltransferase family protein [Balneolaceae bacterium]|nr:nucleotidyltransferase family protein [Balneolaceae bacterium]